MNGDVSEDVEREVAAALGGDKQAAERVLHAIQDGIYELSLRMLGHPADAEDATQEILIIVLTHLGSFRAESAFRTWVWRIAVRHLARTRRGRREIVTFEVLDERLRTGLRELPAQRSDPEADALSRELRLRCTEAMILSLERDLRIAYLLGDVMELSGQEAADILEIDPASYRKRLSRARERLHAFVRGWCGVYDAANPCRCAKQVSCAVERKLLVLGDLDWSTQRSQAVAVSVDRAATEVTGLIQLAEVLRGPSRYLAPDSLVKSVRELLQSKELELLRV